MARQRNALRGEGWNISFVCGPTPNPKLCEIGSRFSSVEEGKTSPLPSLPHPFRPFASFDPTFSLSCTSFSHTRSSFSTPLKVTYPCLGFWSRCSDIRNEEPVQENGLVWNIFPVRNQSMKRRYQIQGGNNIFFSRILSWSGAGIA